jgi:hypothetical protein
MEIDDEIEQRLSQPALGERLGLKGAAERRERKLAALQDDAGTSATKDNGYAGDMRTARDGRKPAWAA